MTFDDLKHPPLPLLVKLGSIAVHADEILHPTQTAAAKILDARFFDEAAIRTVLEDPEVKAWLEGMDALGFLPKKRG